MPATIQASPSHGAAERAGRVRAAGACGLDVRHGSSGPGAAPVPGYGPEMVRTVAGDQQI